MLEIRRIQPAEWASYRSLRLRALADCPSAFGTTLLEAQAQPEAYWRRRAEEAATSHDSMLVIARDDARWVGLAGGHCESALRDLFELNHLWVEPESRRRGVAAALCEAVERWAREESGRTLQLWVTNINLPAVALYAHLGFAATGETMPHPSIPGLLETLMVKAL